MAASDRCPQCGGVDCEQHFHNLLALEYVDARYGVVHHLTVPTYMLQHPRDISAEGWRNMRQTLHAFVIDGVAPREHRAAIRDEVAAGARTWSFKKGPRISLPPDFRWTQNIDAIDESDAAAYRRQIETWARRTLEDALGVAS